MISIVTPLYNSEKYIAETIESVISQSYKDWELLVIDDCSTDDSKEIVEHFCSKDNRIKYFRTEIPSGSPTLPRNIGIGLAQGDFIAFLDSDDIWKSDKLETQIKLFENKNVAIVFSNYEKISENGFSSNRIIIAPLYVKYKKLLKGNVIACCTCIYDTRKVGKRYFSKQGHEDYALWLEILRDGYVAMNTGLVSSQYRVRKTSVSSNKFRTIFWVYNIFRSNEKLSFLKSMLYTSVTLTKSFFKYLK
jgi:glycosyltransferase involved in cell wall biosynthesis